MEKIYLKARAKVNLTLSILDKRPDNYHNLESVFQKISLYDELYIEKNSENVFELDTNMKGVSLEENIIYKAYKKLKERFSEITGVKVTLNKKLPMQAGLAGGSTDCASFLLGMKKLYSLDFPKEELLQMAKRLGADVVPCMYNGVIKASGIGEVITEIESNFKYYFVIIKPKNIFCSTKDMYEKLDKRKSEKVIKTEQMLTAIKERNIVKMADSLYNDFEKVANEIEEIDKAKKDLKENGAVGSMLAGAGAAVFGIFDKRENAKKAYRSLKEEYEAYICTSYNKEEK